MSGFVALTSNSIPHLCGRTEIRALETEMKINADGPETEAARNVYSGEPPANIKVAQSTRLRWREHRVVERVQIHTNY